MVPPRKPIKKQVGRNSMLNPANRTLQTNSKPLAFHQKTIQGAQRLGAITGKAIKTGREIHSQMKSSATMPIARESAASKFYFSRIDSQELQQFFEQYDQQFKGNSEALLEAMEQGNVLPEMFEALEERMTKKEKLELIKLLRKYFDAVKREDTLEISKLQLQARDFLSPIRIRAQI